jgi:hypothetical protein
VTERAVKILLCCGVRLTGKAMGQVKSMLVEVMSRNKYFFQIRISHVLRFISICDVFIHAPS